MITTQDIGRRLGRTPLWSEPRFRVYGVDDAILLASVAASLAGTGASIAGAEKSANERQAAANAELRRQSELQQRGAERVNQSLAQSTRENADQQIQQGAGRREALYQRVGGLAAPNVAPTGNVTATSAASPAASRAQGNALAQAWSRIVAPAQARLGGGSDWGLQQDVKNRRATEDLMVLGDSARGSSRVNQFELQDAAHAGDSLGALGAVLSSLGSVGGAYAATTPRAPRVNAGNGVFPNSFYDPEYLARVARTG